MENNIAVCTSPLTLGFIARARFRAPHPLKDAHIPPTSGKPAKSQQNQSDLPDKTGVVLNSGLCDRRLLQPVATAVSLNMATQKGKAL